MLSRQRESWRDMGWRYIDYGSKKCGVFMGKTSEVGQFANIISHCLYFQISTNSDQGVWGSVESSPSGARGRAPEAILLLKLK